MGDCAGMQGDAADDDWLDPDDLGPLEDCPGCPDTVAIGWVWEPFAEGGPKFLPYARWREWGSIVEVTYDEGASIGWY